MTVCPPPGSLAIIASLENRQTGQARDPNMDTRMVAMSNLPKVASLSCTLQRHALSSSSQGDKKIDTAKT